MYTVLQNVHVFPHSGLHILRLHNLAEKGLMDISTAAPREPAGADWEAVSAAVLQGDQTKGPGHWQRASFYTRRQDLMVLRNGEH